MANEMLDPSMAKMLGDIHQEVSDNYKEIMYIFEDAMVKYREKAAEYQRRYRELVGEKISYH